MSGRSILTAVRGVGPNTLDLPLAALAALAVAFLSFAIPADQLSQLIGSTGLPAVLAAAEPPLGMKARIGVGAASALVIFAIVFATLRLLDRTGKPQSEASPDEAPRLRRRDFHPDAPSRRPISASRDLGEPASPDEPAEAAPLWLSPAVPEQAEHVQKKLVEDEGFDSEGEPEIREFAEYADVEAVEMAEAEPAPPEAESIVFDSPPAASIGELMARLERALARRQPSEQEVSPAAVEAQPTAPAEIVDDRLQSAIESLQRLASRQG